MTNVVTSLFHLYFVLGLIFLVNHLLASLIYFLNEATEVISSPHIHPPPHTQKQHKKHTHLVKISALIKPVFSNYKLFHNKICKLLHNIDLYTMLQIRYTCIHTNLTPFPLAVTLVR